MTATALFAWFAMVVSVVALLVAVHARGRAWRARAKGVLLVQRIAVLEAAQRREARAWRVAPYTDTDRPVYDVGRTRGRMVTRGEGER